MAAGAAGNGGWSNAMRSWSIRGVGFDHLVKCAELKAEARLNTLLKTASF